MRAFWIALLMAAFAAAGCQSGKSSSNGSAPGAATLTSIQATPATANIVVGAAQQFSATGAFSDTTTQDLTSQVSWTSGTASVATIDAAGLAKGMAPGASAIAASFSGVTSNAAALTVTAATPVAPDTGGKPIAFLCATLGKQVCVPIAGKSAPSALAPFPGALQINVGDVSISDSQTGGTTHFSVTVAREAIAPATQWWAAAILMQDLCYGAQMPASGWQWADGWTDGFGQANDGGQSPPSYNVDLERAAVYGFSCPSLALGQHQMWAIIAPDDGPNGTVYTAWWAQGGPISNNVPPTDPAVQPLLTHTAIITFNAVP